MKDLNVVTLSTDGAYPERAAYLHAVELAFPQFTFLEIKSHRHLERHGYPVDVVPLKYTKFGAVTQGASVRYQPYSECCYRGIWKPMHEAMQHLNVTEIYRGQRDEEAHTVPIKDGEFQGGIQYHLPIASWTRADVLKFVKAMVPDLVPGYYDTEQTSRDCWDCTAYLAENQDRIRNLTGEARVQVTHVLDQWHEDIMTETRW
jgi:3'-phosphoadenosine 5'-phosphosulfate sulfotransferase (PAPS reductase)/FAD synthetase